MLDSRKVLNTFEIPVSEDKKIKFTQGENVTISDSGWLVSLDDPEKKAQVSPSFKRDAEKARMVSENRNRG